jgi:hypothetical protein
MDNYTYYLEQEGCWDEPCEQQDYSYADETKEKGQFWKNLGGLFGGGDKEGKEGSNWDAQQTQELIGTGLNIWQTYLQNRPNQQGGQPGGGQQPIVIQGGDDKKSNTGLIVGVGAVALGGGMSAEGWAGIGVAALGIIAPLWASNRARKKEEEMLRQQQQSQKAPIIIQGGDGGNKTTLYMIGGVLVLGIIGAVVIANKKK